MHSRIRYHVAVRCNIAHRLGTAWLPTWYIVVDVQGRFSLRRGEGWPGGCPREDVLALGFVSMGVGSVGALVLVGRAAGLWLAFINWFLWFGARGASGIGG